LEIDKRYGPEIPPNLTSMPEKAALYATDAYFWEGWEDLEEIAGASAAKLLHAHSLILFRPDAVAARRLRPALLWLPKNGFSVVASRQVSVDRHQVRALWEYQWNAALRERKDACDLLMRACPSLLVAIRTLEPTREPAACRFAMLKGSSNPVLREPGELRGLLNYKSRMLSFIHSPDEPADVVREVALLLEEKDRKGLFKTMNSSAGESADAVNALIDDLYAHVREHSLNLSMAVDRVEAAARRAIWT